MPKHNNFCAFLNQNQICYTSNIKSKIGSKKRREDDDKSRNAVSSLNCWQSSNVQEITRTTIICENKRLRKNRFRSIGIGIYPKSHENEY